jgi:hypothetical protein
MVPRGDGEFGSRHTVSRPRGIKTTELWHCDDVLHNGENFRVKPVKACYFSFQIWLREMFGWGGLFPASAVAHTPRPPRPLPLPCHFTAFLPYFSPCPLQHSRLVAFFPIQDRLTTYGQSVAAHQLLPAHGSPCSVSVVNHQGSSSPMASGHLLLSTRILLRQVHQLLTNH